MTKELRERLRTVIDALPSNLKGGLECHPLTFRRDCLRQNEHHVPPERFLEELSGGSG